MNWTIEQRDSTINSERRHCPIISSQHVAFLSRLFVSSSCTVFRIFNENDWPRWRKSTLNMILSFCTSCSLSRFHTKRCLYADVRMKCAHMGVNSESRNRWDREKENSMNDWNRDQRQGCMKSITKEGSDEFSVDDTYENPYAVCAQNANDDCHDTSE